MNEIFALPDASEARRTSLVILFDFIINCWPHHAALCAHRIAPFLYAVKYLKKIFCGLRSKFGSGSVGKRRGLGSHHSGRVENGDLR